jgi:DNA-binding CsgD family transcriptional regulator
MSLRLSSADLDRAQDVMSVLLSPADGHPEGWQRRVLRTVISFTDADKGMFTMPEARSVAVVAEGLNPHVVTDYPNRMDVIATPWSTWGTISSLGAYNRAMLWGGRLKEYYRTPYWNEYVVPNRGFDMIGLGTCVRGRPEVGTVTQLLVHHDSRTGRRFGERGLLLMQLLLPAFRAGTANYLALAGAHGRLAEMLDRLPTVLLVYDRRGRLLHANAASSRVMTGLGGEALRQEADALARRLLSTPTGATGNVMAPAVDVGVAQDRFRLTASFIGDTELGGGAALFMTVERRAPSGPDPDVLRQRHRLTAKEAEVALLLATEGASNRELAERLHISPHTARHHVEQVLLKLDVKNRAAVGPKLARFG